MLRKDSQRIQRRSLAGLAATLILLLVSAQASANDIISYLDLAEAQIQLQGDQALAVLSDPESNRLAVLQRADAARPVILNPGFIVPLVADRDSKRPLGSDGT